MYLGPPFQNVCTLKRAINKNWKVSIWKWAAENCLKTDGNETIASGFLPCKKIKKGKFS
jgi:hypothetical protein